MLAMQVSTDIDSDHPRNGQEFKPQCSIVSQEAQPGVSFLRGVTSCFTQRTWVITKNGSVRVRALRAGHMVQTRDHGFQPIRWVGRRATDPADVAEPGHLWPIRIKRNALGNNSPERQLVVSPKHRILLAGEDIQRKFDVPEILVAAQDLIGMPGIKRVRPEQLTYVYFMFDQHELVMGNEVWSESCQPTDQMISILSPGQRATLFDAFPQFRSTNGLSGYPAARHTLNKTAVESLLAPT